jgi:hypothetical protein
MVHRAHGVQVQTVRVTTAGRIACSAAQGVAGTDGVVRNGNHDST